jgi:transposase-like protein
MEKWQPCYSSLTAGQSHEKKLKNCTPEEKFKIFKTHLLNNKPVSEICDQYDLQPTVFYGWQKQLFEKGVSAFENNQKRTEKRLKKKIENLEEKIIIKMRCWGN